MVRADRVCPLKVNQTDTVPVMCVHGDSEDYPTTEVDLLLEGTKRKVRAVVAPGLPVPVVLGTDVYDVQEGWKDVELGLLVETRAAKKRRVAEEETAAGNVVQAVSKGIEPNGSGLVNDDKVIDGDEFVGEGSTHSKPTEGKQVVVDENIEVRDALDDCEGIAELFNEGSEVNWQGDMVENEVHGGNLELRREELEQDPSEAKKVTKVDYEVETPGRRREKKVYHINLLKKWNSAPEKAMLAVMESRGAESPEAGGLYLWGSEIQMTMDEIETPGLGFKERQQLLEVMEEFPAIFSSTPGRTSLTHHQIHVEGTVPVRQKPYRVPYSKREMVKQELEKMLEAKVIQPSTSPWASPIVLVEKTDGSVRFCIDYRKLNQRTKFDAYPMPRIEEVLESIGSAAIISTLDLAKGYWQIPLSEDAREKSAFTTPFGLYEFLVMPFGLHSAPATFQRTMNQVLCGCESFAGAYLDDVVIYSKSWEEHVDHLKEIFGRLNEAGLTLKVAKCQFGCKEVRYLGHVIGGGRVQPDPRKLQAIAGYPRPRTKKDVRAFLGLVGYYRRFISGFSEVAAALTDLTRKKMPDQVQWDSQCEEAFRKLKEALLESPVLSVADPTKPFILQTDASERGLGAVLSQEGCEGEQHPVAYASRKLYPRERNYSTVEKECLAVIWALRVYNTYLYGQKFTIETDHQPLTWLNRMKNTNARLIRWSLAIQPYDYTLTHRRGVANGNADGLSRGPVDEEMMEGQDRVSPGPSS